MSECEHTQLFVISMAHYTSHGQWCATLQYYTENGSSVLHNITIMLIKDNIPWALTCDLSNFSTEQEKLQHKIINVLCNKVFHAVV